MHIQDRIGPRFDKEADGELYVQGVVTKVPEDTFRLATLMDILLEPMVFVSYTALIFK